MTVLLLSNGCKTVSNTGVDDLPKADMLENNWVLTSMNGTDLDEAFSERKPDLKINLEDDKVSGFGGCNNYFGGIVLKGDSIKIGPLGSTMMACPSMEAEHKYMGLLEKVEMFKVNDKELKLLYKGIPTLVFKKQQGE